MYTLNKYNKQIYYYIYQKVISASDIEKVEQIKGNQQNKQVLVGDWLGRWYSKYRPDRKGKG